MNKREEKVWHDQNVQTDRLQSFDFLRDRVQEADFVAGRATHGLRDKRVGEQQRNDWPQTSGSTPKPGSEHRSSMRHSPFDAKSFTLQAVTAVLNPRLAFHVMALCTPAFLRSRMVTRGRRGRIDWQHVHAQFSVYVIICVDIG